MNLAADYKRQFGWRDWATVFDALPGLQGKVVVDLGCGIGDLAAEFVARGATVVGFDMNEDLLREAQARQLPNALFRLGDLRGDLELDFATDGLWCGFLAAYFPNLAAALAAWITDLRPGGWVALTEIDDLFGHEPMNERTRERLKAYAREALAAGRYDFHMGRKLRSHLEVAGLRVSKMLRLHDQELSFDGPAHPEVLEAWRARFGRMTLLRDFCGSAFDETQDDFLECLSRADHRSLATVHCCIAIR